MPAKVQLPYPTLLQYLLSESSIITTYKNVIILSNNQICQAHIK